MVAPVRSLGLLPGIPAKSHAGLPGPGRRTLLPRAGRGRRVEGAQPLRGGRPRRHRHHDDRSPLQVPLVPGERARSRTPSTTSERLGQWGNRAPGVSGLLADSMTSTWSLPNRKRSRFLGPTANSQDRICT